MGTGFVHAYIDMESLQDPFWSDKDLDQLGGIDRGFMSASLAKQALTTESQRVRFPRG